MRILLTENSPFGMLALSSVEHVIIDFCPLGRYEDPLFDASDFMDLCMKSEFSKQAIHICNKSPWSDLVWSHPETVEKKYSYQEKQQELYNLKFKIYSACGWKPDAIINIYDKAPDSRWRNKLDLLSRDDPNMTIVGINASDPNFTKNLLSAIKMLDNREIDPIFIPKCLHQEP
jgi:hypothetical protein